MPRQHRRDGDGERLPLNAEPLRGRAVQCGAEDEDGLRGDNGLIHGSSSGAEWTGLARRFVKRRDSPPAYT